MTGYADEPIREGITSIPYTVLDSMKKEIKFLRNKLIDEQMRLANRVLRTEDERDELQRRLDILWEWIGQQSDAQWKFKYDIPEAKTWFEEG